MTVDTFKSQNRGGKGIKGMQTIDEDLCGRVVYDVDASLYHVLYEYRACIPLKRI